MAIRLTLSILVIFAALAAGPVHAFCFFWSTTAVNFGTYDPFSALPDDSTGSVRVQCILPAVNPYTLKLSTGTSGTFASRQLSSGVDRLNYNLFRDAARTQIWGDGTAGTSFVSSPGHSGAATYTIYGRIPAGQDPTVGSYSDTIVITMDY